MLVATDTQRLARLAYLHRLDAEEALALRRRSAIWLWEMGVLTMAETVDVIEGQSAIGKLVAHGRAIETVERTEGKRKRQETQATSALQILLGSKEAARHIEEFVAECRENGALRDKAEEIGIDIDDWAEQLRDAQTGGSDD